MQYSFNWSALVLCDEIVSTEHKLKLSHGNPRIEIGLFPDNCMSFRHAVDITCVVPEGAQLFPQASIQIHELFRNVETSSAVFSLLTASTGVITPVVASQAMMPSKIRDIFVSGQIIGHLERGAGRHGLATDSLTGSWLDSDVESRTRWEVQVSYIRELEERVQVASQKTHTLETHIANIEHHIDGLRLLCDELLKANNLLNIANDELLRQNHEYLCMAEASSVSKHSELD